MRRTVGLSALAFLILALGFAAAASAQVTYRMTGEWFMNRGPLIDIPNNGGPMSCAGGTPSGCIGQAGWGLEPVNGGIPGMAPVAVGTARSFTVPPNAFG